MTITQQHVDRIIARAQNSAMGLGDPMESKRRPYDLAKYARPDLESLACLLVNAHDAKYDLISLFTAALEELVKP